MKVIVWHDSYGCDTGCCGHWVKLLKDDGRHQDSDFTFGHPDGFMNEDFLDWAKKQVIKFFGEHHVVDLDWEHCLVLDD